MTVFDELHLQSATVERAADLIKDRLRDWEIDDALFVIDPAARQRSQITAETVASEYSRFGIHCAHGQNAVEAGIFQIKRRLQARPHPTLHIASNCTRLLYELARYRFKDSADGSFQVVKVDDHLLDAMRYAAMFLPDLATAEEIQEEWRYDGTSAPPASYFQNAAGPHNPMA